MVYVSQSTSLNADREAVLGILLDVTEYPSWQDSVEKVVLEEADEQGRPLRTTTHVVALGQRASHTVRYEYPSADGFEYHLVEADVFTKNDFTCTVTDLGGGTTEVAVTQEVTVDLPMPDAMLEKLTKKGVDGLLTALKAKAEQS